ncbi:hypothetical protein [Clostridium butyricum]|nr:hypothetical protein [Clostridium butyricum]
MWEITALSEHKPKTQASSLIDESLQKNQELEDILSKAEGKDVKQTDTEF